MTNRVIMRGLALATLLVLGVVVVCGRPAAAAPRSKDPYRIQKMILARDDGHGNPGTQVTSFRPSDNPLHCVVRLAKAKKGLRVHFRWIVIDGDGVKNLVVLENVYTARDERDLAVNNEWRRKTKAWPPGTYRVEAMVEGAHQNVTIDFQIK